MTNNDFEKHVLSYVQPGHLFQPSAHYDSDGDCIEFFAKPDDYVSERIDGLVTVYRSRDTKEIIGSLIKDVKKLIRDNLGVKIIVKDGRAKLEHLFVACAGGLKEPEQYQTIVYTKLHEIAQEANVDTEVPLVAAN